MEKDTGKIRLVRLVTFMLRSKRNKLKLAVMKEDPEKTMSDKVNELIDEYLNEVE